MAGIRFHRGTEEAGENPSLQQPKVFFDRFGDQLVFGRPNPK
jgi:hypothetical protein